MLVLFLPAVVCFAWPLRSPATQRIRAPLVWLGAMLFIADGAVRGFLQDAYGAAPDSSLVLSSVANSNVRESAEYLHTNWRAMTLWLVACPAAAVVAWRLAGHTAKLQAREPRKVLMLALVLCLLLAAIGHASKPWRRLHPLIFWPEWVVSLDALRISLADQDKRRDAAFERARALGPVVDRKGPSTVVLVLTDSVNRDNMSLYGYARTTTPRLAAQAQQLGSQMLTLRNAWSVNASTLPSLQGIFGFGTPGQPDSQHLLALARAAGYKVWWMSNHDDMAIEQQHARMADVVEFENRTPGRSSASLDGELLDCLREALEDPTARKLIVVHLLGAHPHYRLRFPSGENPFNDHPDKVDQQLAEQGRASWVRRFRQEYDAALLYHDSVVSEMLRLTTSTGRAQDYRAWVYLSDHGQEVGHVRDQAGHSPMSESGYRIPALIWSNDPTRLAAANLALRPFRADWAGWTLSNLLNLRWNDHKPTQDVLDEHYEWKAPQLPIPIQSFLR